MTDNLSDLHRDLALRIIHCGGLTLRDVDNGEEPFLYSSGNKGPGYVNIKGLVSRTDLFSALVANLAYKVAHACPGIDFLAANVTGGVPPGVLLRQQISLLLGRDIPMVYVRDTRKAGGLKEHVTGLDGLVPGSHGLVVEELVNYATTTVNSTKLLRSLGFQVENAACIVNYDTLPNRDLLAENAITLTHLYTIEDLLAVCERNIDISSALTSYREFLANPSAWMEKHGLVREERGGTK